MSHPLLPVRPDSASSDRASSDRQVLVTGSLAFDQIMIFPGQFKDHILPDKLHLINISFLVEEMRQLRGGCAGNIAYTMALLGERPRVLAAAGHDFGDYLRFLQDEGVDTAGIRICDNDRTASCFITTDQANNQITGFFVGAMARAAELSLRATADERTAFAVIAPDDPAAMLRHAEEARQAGLPFVFDPSFQVTAMDGEALANAARGATVMMCNDYEAAVFAEKTGLEGDAIFDLVEVLVVTLGAEGSSIRRRGEPEVRVPAVPVSAVVDPTGAGDAFRGGFATALLRGHGLAVAGRMGATAAAYAIERKGTQSHRYTPQDFAERYAATYGPMPQG